VEANIGPASKWAASRTPAGLAESKKPSVGPPEDKNKWNRGDEDDYEIEH
jgi:hypothetical protein